MTPTCASPMNGCRYGFSMACLVASAADSVMVMTKSVAANPSRMSTRSLPLQPGSRFSSIAIDP